VTSARAAALAALNDTLAGIEGLTVVRGGARPVSVPAGGLVILRDGDPGEPEVTLGPVSYLWHHRAAVEVLVAEDDPATLDTLLQAIGDASAVDPTLGGAADWAEPSAPETEDLAVEGGAEIRAALATVTLVYPSTTPLGD
jgi:hypothetical protein